MIEVTLLGTGSPMADPNRAGPSTLVRAGDQTFLVDCGRGVLHAGGGGRCRRRQHLTALLLTHLHSDHITDLGDVIITRWVTTFDPDPPPLPIIGPPGTAEVVDATLKAFGHRTSATGSRTIADITGRPRRGGGGHRGCGVGQRRRADPGGADRSSAGEPTIGFRVESAGASVVLAGDTVPCASLDELAAGAGALVHTVIRKDLVEQMPRNASATSRLPLVGRGGRGHRRPRRRRHSHPHPLRAGHRARPGGRLAGTGRDGLQQADRTRRRPASRRGAPRRVRRTRRGLIHQGA